MKKYWIIVDGKPVGPFSQSELKVRNDFGAQLPVWCAELPDWTTVGNLPELACLLEEEVPAEEAQPAVAEKPQSEPKATFDNIAGMRASAMWIDTKGPEEIDGMKRPSSYIGWNILMLICCCLPGGIVGIIFGSQVNSRWMRGDARGAQKASEIAAWCLILSFVIGLVAWPFQLVFSAI